MVKVGLGPDYSPVDEILHYSFLEMVDENPKTEGIYPLVWRPDLARVLVIDECQEFRDWAAVVLQSEGFDVIETRDMLAGLQRAVEDSPDLVVLSGYFSALDGLEVCERIANDPASRGIPIIVVADDSAPRLGLRAWRAGAAAVAPRSFLAADLCGPVHDLLCLSGSARTPPAASHAIPLRQRLLS